MLLKYRNELKFLACVGFYAAETDEDRMRLFAIFRIQDPDLTLSHVPRVKQVYFI